MALAAEQGAEVAGATLAAATDVEFGRRRGKALGDRNVTGNPYRTAGRHPDLRFQADRGTVLAMSGDHLGYERASTQKESLELQLDALSAAGCARVWSDAGTGQHTRSGLTEVLDCLRPNGTVGY